MKILQKLAIVLLLSVTMIGCGGDSPSDVATAFLTAMAKNDYTKAGEYGTENTKKMMSMIAGFSAMAPQEPKFEKFEVLKEEIKGDTATVTFKTFKGETEEDAPPFDLVKVDGKWLVDMKKKAGM